MSKTAIVPVAPTPQMEGAGWDDYDICDGELCMQRLYWVFVKSRPPVPDELIEEAAKAMHAAVWSTPWGRVTEDARDECRSMARAAARVFNGGKDD